MDQEHELRDRAGEVLRTHGPMRADMLLAELHLDDLDEVGALDPRGLWDLLLLGDEADAFAAYPLADGRLCDLTDLLDGLTLTHVINEQERAAGAVAFAPDLTALHLASGDGRTLPLAGSPQPLSLTEDLQLTGPHGWLPEQDVLVTRLVDGHVEVAGRDTVPDIDATAARRLADTRAALRAADPEHRVDEVELLVETRARYPRLLADPQAPLGDLLTAEGLVATGVDVLDADEAAAEPDPDEALTEHLYADHGLDEDEVLALLRLQADVLHLSHEVLRASVERLRATIDAGGQVDPARLTDADRQQLAEALGSVDLEAAAARLAVILASTDGALALVEDVLDDDPIAAACLLALLIHAAPADRGRGLRANLAWVRARALELTADDHAAAERELRRAVEADDTHGPATYDLAVYLSDRGQAGAALGLARRVEGPGVDELVETLIPYTRPGPMAAGRNEACPCGSGRKHKACCARHDGWPLAERMPWLMHKLLAFYSSPYARDVVTETARACAIEDGPGQLDVAALNLALFEGGIIADLCELRGSLLPADELARLRAWAGVRGSVYELVEADDDGTCVLLDLRTGERATLVDRSLAATLEVGGAVLAWLVEGDEHPVPFYGVLPVPDHARAALLDLLDEQPSATRLGAWLRAMHAPPRLATTTGEELVAVEQVYGVGEPETARAALAAHLEEDPDGTLHAFLDGDGQRTARGSVTIEGQCLTVSALSVSRARWFADLLAEVVPDAQLIDEQRLTAADWAAREQPTSGDEDDPGLPTDLEVLPAEARAQLEEQLDTYMAEQEDAWVDTPLPALGGATPRQAIADPTRRDEVHRLLEQLDADAADWPGPGRGLDADRLRRLLGLT